MYKVRKLVILIFLLGLDLSLAAQVKKSGTELDNDLSIAITQKYGNSGVSSKADYYYKGKLFTIDSWANNLMEIVKDNPDAVNEIKKYRIKTFTATSLGIASVGFAIPPSIQFLNDRKINVLSASLALISGITASVLMNQRNNNIRKAAEYYNKNITIVPNIHNREMEFATCISFKFNIKL